MHRPLATGIDSTHWDSEQSFAAAGTNDSNADKAAVLNSERIGCTLR